jgi:hypothetical protein
MFRPSTSGKVSGTQLTGSWMGAVKVRPALKVIQQCER